MFGINTKPHAGIMDTFESSSFPYSLIAAATTNATLVKPGPGVITAIHAIGTTAAIKYLKFYDTNKSPTAGNGVPVRRYAIPGSTTGAGFAYAPPIPLKFVSGIAFTITGASTDSDTTALALADVILTLEYV